MRYPSRPPLTSQRLCKGIYEVWDPRAGNNVRTNTTQDMIMISRLNEVRVVSGTQASLSAVHPRQSLTAPRSPHRFTNQRRRMIWVIECWSSNVRNDAGPASKLAVPVDRGGHDHIDPDIK